MINDLLIVSYAGNKMTPESTWLEPKLRFGVVVRLLDYHCLLISWSVYI